MGKWRSIDYEKWLKSELRTLESSKINNEDKERIRQYLDFRLANGVSVARASREIICLRLLCERYGLSLGDIDEARLNKSLARLNTSGLKVGTVNEFRKAIRWYLKFIGREDLAVKIKKKEPKDNELTKSDLLTKEELLKLISVAINDRDPALIACHYDLACRPEELLTLTVGAFIRDSFGIRVELKRSKTFRRSLYLSSSLPFVARWLSVHPLRDDPEAPMWLDLNKFRRRIVAPIDHFAYRRLLIRLAKRAGIKKKITPYRLRHTGVTDYAEILPEPLLCKRAGLVPGSKNLRRYTKIVEIDADKKILKELGLIKEEEAKAEIKKLQPLKCGVCGELNEPSRDRCWKCKAVLDPIRLAKEFNGSEIIESVMDSNLEKMIEEKIKKMFLEMLRGEGKIKL
ncbi:MAG: site-specific integrase [Archaeoglobaceae archaeon]